MPLEFLVVRVKMLDGRDHALALNSLDVSDRQAAREVGILTEALEISTPERGAVDVHGRPQNHVATQSFHFLADRLPVSPRQFSVPGGAHGDAGGKSSGGYLLSGGLPLGLRRRSGPRPYAERTVRHFYGG